MKSLRINSYDSRVKTIKHQSSVAKHETKTDFHEKPSPLHFDSFIPWFCLELQVPRNVVVMRTNQVEYVRRDSKLSKGSSTKSSKSKSKATKMKLSVVQSAAEEKLRTSVPRISFATSTIDIHDAIPITTCYDKRGHLIEIAIVGCRFAIPREVIRAFNLCLPFHSGLYKLSVRRGGLCPPILYEISKLLPHSNITDICLDDSRVIEGNYSILLDQPSQIQYLSLKRCGIDSKECKNIATKLDLNGPAMKTLLLLDLSSNFVKDEGAEALGEMLKNNRYLMYLNISGNSISDVGASFILRYLQEFPLTNHDVIEKRRRRMDYLKSRLIIYEKCLQEAKLARRENDTKTDFNTIFESNKPRNNVLPQNKPKKNKKQRISTFNFTEETTVEDDAEKKTREIIGNFEDPFEEQYITRKDNVVYGLGNFTLASLNLAYNNLSLLSIRKILKILQYQVAIHTLTPYTGLVRVEIDGNNIPTQCKELHQIDICLKTAIMQNEHSFSLNRHNSHYKV